MVGDLPFANVRPPENVLFVCKLNPVTRDEDLELIFSRFGPIMSCQVIRDKRTGDSLQYAFIEFDRREDAEQAYFKMQNVLVDDRRIWVDLCVGPLLFGRAYTDPSLPARSPSPVSIAESGQMTSRWVRARARVDSLDATTSKRRAGTGQAPQEPTAATTTWSSMSQKAVTVVARAGAEVLGVTATRTATEGGRHRGTETTGIVTVGEVAAGTGTTETGGDDDLVLLRYLLQMNKATCAPADENVGYKLCNNVSSNIRRSMRILYSIIQFVNFMKRPFSSSSAARHLPQHHSPHSPPPPSSTATSTSVYDAA